MKKLFAAALLAGLGMFAAAQDAGTGETDPFADLDALFEDPESAVIEESEVIEDPTASVLGGNPFMWAGDFSSSLGVEGSYEELAPSADELADPGEKLDVGIDARLWFDARPDKDYRVFGKLAASYPFATDVLAPDGSVESVNNIRIFELFSDFNWNDRLFFRFGKQTAGWGLSRFYQIADPLSVGVKDPNDPAADLEGPIALKVSMPFGVNNLYFYGAVKDSYLPDDIGDASIRDLGAGVKADFYVPVPDNSVFGNADMTLGVYYQRKLAPKAVAGLSTSVGKFQVFTDQVLSWGLDSYRLTDDEIAGGSPAGMMPGTAYETEKSDEGLWYSATLGTMYVNNDWHFTLYGEYLFSAAASSDDKYLEKWLSTYYAEQAGTGTPDTLAITDAFGYLSRHNTGLSLSWSELFGTDKLSFSAVWLQNWVDKSGMLTPTLAFKPFDHLEFDTGMNLSWGDDKSEWVLKNADPSSLEARRITGFIRAKIGGGKF